MQWKHHPTLPHSRGKSRHPAELGSDSCYGFDRVEQLAANALATRLDDTIAHAANRTRTR